MILSRSSAGKDISAGGIISCGFDLRLDLGGFEGVPSKFTRVALGLGVANNSHRRSRSALTARVRCGV